MDPTARSILILTSPRAIYTSERNEHVDVSSSDQPSLQPFNDSPLLVPISTQHHEWEIDGGEADGVRFFAIPKFARGRAPRRIDVVVPDPEEHRPALRRHLLSDSSMLLASTDVGSSRLSKHLIMALNIWSIGIPDFEEKYMNLPFGSWIAIQNLDRDPRLMEPCMFPRYEVEQQLLPQATLQAMWETAKPDWPPVLSLLQLELVRQPFPTISLVRITGGDSGVFVFKAVPEDLKHFYHELKLLLTTTSHPNVISRPKHIISLRTTLFDRSVICGFLLEYHPGGTLRDLLSSACQTSITLHDQFRWAKAMTSALMHLQQSPPRFFSNLKLNNIVMANRGEGIDPVLIDFEQRLGPASWSPPEVHYVQHIAHLAEHSPCASERDGYQRLMLSYDPLWQPPTRSAGYNNAELGYCHPWSIMSPAGQEAAQVFMLGKLLWCIFERTWTVNTDITVDTFREDERHYAFPNFRLTPNMLQDCIIKCTIGAPEWEGRHFSLARKGVKIVPRERLNDEPDTIPTSDVLRSARHWWSEHIKSAEAYIGACARYQQGASLPQDVELVQLPKKRPTLAEVYQLLELAEAEGCN